MTNLSDLILQAIKPLINMAFILPKLLFNPLKVSIILFNQAVYKGLIINGSYGGWLGWSQFLRSKGGFRKAVVKETVAFEFGFVAGHDRFVKGGVFGVEAGVKEVDYVQGFVVKVNGEGFCSGVTACDDDGVVSPGDAGFGLAAHVSWLFLSSVLLFFLGFFQLGFAV